MIIPCFAFNSIDEYQNCKDTLSVEKPRQCEHCRAIGCFWGHGSFKRTVLQEGAETEIRIPRFLCHSCGKTVSLLFAFLVAYRRHSVQTIAAAIETYSKKEATYRQLSVDLSDLDSRDIPPSPAHSSVFKWVEIMMNRANSLSAQTQKELVLRGKFEELAEAKSSPCPNSFKSACAKKQTNLNALSEFVSLGALLVSSGTGVTARLHTFFLKNVETIQMILSGRLIRLSAPQSLKHYSF